MENLTLDGLDRNLLHALQVEARAPFARIATVIGSSDQTVKRRYRRLVDTGMLRVFGLPDTIRLGHLAWMLRMQCTPDAAAPIAEALARREDTSWVSLYSGGTEIVCVTQGPDRDAYASLLLHKLPRTPKVVNVSAHYLLKNFDCGPKEWPAQTATLTGDQIAALEPLAVDPSLPAAISSADAPLLTVLARDGRASLTEIAAATGWSESTAGRRLDHLRTCGAIYLDVDIDATLLGYAAEAMLWLTVAPSALDAVGTELASWDEVSFMAATTGNTNLVAVVVCRDTAALYDFLAHRIGSIEGIRRMETAPLIRRVKRAGALLAAP
ncbi:DNA-binding Lrp family transcriptional regulator [Allocatelliglobosispora scoriae]|uniref:DNA-binding Lrp family transcriptional regulator n=1 Tax=Allocatelliglobosispora scoriae TaxID=643052 RepID=A0A841BMK8_9ACTN|nr:Lrp/AsnC family transcriptional regulator [Allocatelliglobosispora scoriae]MBB5868213.1 DNA-binding Lrp family transcriptional regulator [Allocatelliglobosispora scoriae]